LFNAQDEYEKLVKEWESLEMFDEADKLVQKLVAYYCKLIEDMLFETSLILKEKLQLYQETI